MRFFPGVKVQGSVAAVMAASVFVAGVAALAVLVVVMAATNVGVIAERAREQRVDRLIRFAADAAVELNARFRQRHLSAAADAAADQRVHTVPGQENGQRAVAAAVGKLN